MSTQNTSSPTTNTLLQVRIKPEDKQMIENVAAMYGLDVKQFVVLATQYMEQVKPTLEISPAGKGFAPTPVLQAA